MHTITMMQIMPHTWEFIYLFKIDIVHEVHKKEKEVMKNIHNT